MNQSKEEILFHFERSIDFVKKLAQLSEENWRTPIAKDKWTVAEVIGHLTPWDEFLLVKRLPYLFKDTPMPKAPNQEEFNRKSAEVSRNRSKEETISNFIKVRRNLIIAINNMDDELWEKDLKIGENSLTLYEYVKGFIEHDYHHFEQINKLTSTQSHM